MRLGVIGFGNMGAAIAKGIVEKKAMDINDIGIFDIYTKSREKAREYGFKVYSDEIDLTEHFDKILVAVKPIHAKALFEKISEHVDGKLIMSIVAGLESADIKSYIGEQRVLRIMPNTPALVGEGVFALDSESNATEEEKEEIERIFTAIGLVE